MCGGERRHLCKQPRCDLQPSLPHLTFWRFKLPLLRNASFETLVLEVASRPSKASSVAQLATRSGTSEEEAAGVEKKLVWKICSPQEIARLVAFHSTREPQHEGFGLSSDDLATSIGHVQFSGIPPSPASKAAGSVSSPETSLETSLRQHLNRPPVQRGQVQRPRLDSGQISLALTSSPRRESAALLSPSPPRSNRLPPANFSSNWQSCPASDAFGHRPPPLSTPQAHLQEAHHQSQRTTASTSRVRASSNSQASCGT